MKFARRSFAVFSFALGQVLLASASMPAHAEWLLDFDIGTLYDTNLTRAQKPADIRADAAGTLSASAGSFIALTGADGLTLTIDAHGGGYGRFRGLNFIALGGTAMYRHKFGLGYAAPWVSVAVSASHDDYRENLRDSDRVVSRAELGKRFTETVDAAIGAMAERRYASQDEPVVPGISGKAFDLRGRSAYVRAGYAVNERLLLGAKMAVRRGEVVSTTRRDFEIFKASSAIAADPTFGSDFFAYRLRGTTRTATITGSWAVNERASLNFSYADEYTGADRGLDYRSRVANISFAYRY